MSFNITKGECYMRINKVQNQPAFGAKICLSGDTTIIKQQELKKLAKKAEQIAGKDDVINFHIQYLGWETKSIPLKDGGNDLVTTFTRDILASYKINGAESKEKNITPFLTDETHNCKWLDKDSILNKPFEYMSKYIDKVAEKFSRV